MTNKEAVVRALRTGDAEAAGRIAERMRCGGVKLKDGTPVLFTYADMLDFVARCTGWPVAEVGPEWEALLAEAS